MIYHSDITDKEVQLYETITRAIPTSNGAVDVTANIYKWDNSRPEFWGQQTSHISYVVQFSHLYELRYFRDRNDGIGYEEKDLSEIWKIVKTYFHNLGAFCPNRIITERDYITNPFFPGILNSF